MTDPDDCPSILVKYGGNAMTDAAVRDRVLAEIGDLHDSGARLVLVHGGGPAIAEILAEVGLETEFVGGHRRTDARTIGYVQMALRGRVNGDLVRRLCAVGQPAVGLSGKDAAMVRARRRYHEHPVEGAEAQRVDLGFVGDVDTVDTELLDLLLASHYLPVVAPLALGHDDEVYNVNADMFAAHLAAALGVELFVAMTDVDGLRRVPDDPSTVIHHLPLGEIDALMGTSIQGGMIPKVEACAIAVTGGVPRARIVDGTREGALREALERTTDRGTEITP
ncbi:MAG TPA: acetylglutamate kinase [Candidatus Krumholzibacteria bacterium]|nr:acetylglutamate kinase [Candidatus Krumholzibacteria bacterium]